MLSTKLAWRVEEACLNAWPALRQLVYGGWVLRFGAGLTRRANSVNPLKSGRNGPDALIAGCEAIYRFNGQPTIFRLPSLIDDAVDRRLTARGYGLEGLSLVLHGKIGTVPAERDPVVELLERPSRQWFAAMAALQRHTAEQARIYRQIVESLSLPARFAAIADNDGGFAALAFGAIHDGVICYESVVTDPRRQRRGYGRRIITTLAAWAAEQGADGACLEVEAANAPARALYDALGFAELYRYHYRREPVTAAH
jgi:N-acetylglutamate synthase